MRKNLLILLFLTVSLYSKGQTVRGQVVDGINNLIISYSPVVLLDEAGVRIKDSVMTDGDGEFKFTKVSVGIYSIAVNYKQYNETIFHNIKIRRDTILNLDIHKPCKYDSSVHNKTCPKCKKQDEVIPICYGLLVRDKEAGNKKRDCFPGGCVVSGCDPHWFCKRDKTKF